MRRANPIRRALLRGLSTLPPDLTRPFRVGAPFIFYYHLVSDEDLPHLQHYRYKNRRQFTADVVVAARRFSPLRREEIEEARDRPLRRESVLLTFDDGFRECHEVVRPILLDHGLNAVFFVTTELIDNRRCFFESQIGLCIDRVVRLPDDEARELADRIGVDRRLAAGERARAVRVAASRLARGRIPEPGSPAMRSFLLWLLALQRGDGEAIAEVSERLGIDVPSFLRDRRPYLTGDQIRRLDAEGFTIGAHGVTHSRLQDLSAERAEEEIVRSCETIRSLTGRPRIPFSFPYSARGFSVELLTSIRRRHPWIGPFFDTRGLSPPHPILYRRQWADQPHRAGERSDLPWRLRRAAAARLLTPS